MAALAMEDVRAMQRDGPTEEEVATAVEVETRALEVRAQENAYWREYFEAVHNSRLAALLDGDLDKLYAITERTRTELMRGLNPEQIRAHLHRCLDANNRVVVVLRPQRSWWAGAAPGPKNSGGARGTRRLRRRRRRVRVHARQKIRMRRRNRTYVCTTLVSWAVRAAATLAAATDARRSTLGFALKSLHRPGGSLSSSDPRSTVLPPRGEPSRVCAPPSPRHRLLRHESASAPLGWRRICSAPWRTSSSRARAPPPPPPPRSPPRRAPAPLAHGLAALPRPPLEAARLPRHPLALARSLQEHRRSVLARIRAVVPVGVAGADGHLRRGEVLERRLGHHDGATAAATEGERGERGGGVAVRGVGGVAVCWVPVAIVPVVAIAVPRGAPRRDRGSAAAAVFVVARLAVRARGGRGGRPGDRARRSRSRSCPSGSALAAAARSIAFGRSTRGAGCVRGADPGRVERTRPVRADARAVLGIAHLHDDDGDAVAPTRASSSRLMSARLRRPVSSRISLEYG